jgi:hypothetical protein
MPGVVTVSTEIRDEAIGGWSPRCCEVLEKLHDHLEGFTRFIRLHIGRSLDIIPVQSLRLEERNGPEPDLLRMKTAP